MFLLVGGIFLLANPLPVGATVSSGVVAGNAAADLVVGATGADYNTTFLTNTTNTANTITVTFPTGYVITDGDLGSVGSAINNNNGSGSVVTGMVSVNGVNRAVDNVVGSASARTVTVTLLNAYDLSAGTTTFRFLVGIQNATTSGATGTLTIDTNATDETAQTNVAAVTLTPGTATQLVFTTQPASSVSGVSLTQPEVTARDTYGNTDTNFAETITLTEDGAGDLSGTLATTSVSGVATFSGIKYTAVVDGESFITTATGDTLHVHSNSVTSDVVATRILVTTQPATIVSGVSMVQPVVKYVDAIGTVDTAITTGDTVTITEGSAGSLTAGATTTSATSGVATFSGLIYTAALDQESVTFTFTDNAGGAKAFDGSPVNAATTTANVVATALAINTQPSTIISGVSMTVPIVRYVDLNNATDTDITADILTATDNAAGSITAVSTTTVSSGVATFTGMKYTVNADQEAVQFTFTDDSIGGVNISTPVTSASTTADVVATKLLVTTQPASIISGVSMVQPVIKYVDADNKVDTAITTSDTVAITEGSAGSLTGTTTVSAAAGEVDFAGLLYFAAADEENVTFVFTDNAAGGGAVDFSGSPVNAATTTADVLATGLTVNTEPSNIISGVSMTVPVVHYTNAQGKIDTHIDSDVLTATDNAAGSITAGSTTTASNGIATFTSMIYTAFADAEDVQLIFTDDVAGSGLVNLSATPAVSATTTADVKATQLVVTTPPAGAVDAVALTTQPAIQAQDANGTLDTGATAEVITATTDTSNVSVSGTTTATMTSGIATFSGLIANVDGTFTDGATITLSFNDDGAIGGVDMATTTATTSLGVVATQLVLTTSPSGAVDLVNLTTQPVVKAYDAHNNTDAGVNGEVITATSTTSNVSLVGNTTGTMASGIATFEGLQASIDGTFTDGSEITLSFNDDGGIGGVDMTPVTATTSLGVVATKLSITTAPSGAEDLVNLTGQPVIKAYDAHDNTDAGVTGEVITASITTTDISAVGNTTSTMASGIATFSGLQASVDGTFTDGSTITFSFNDDGGIGGVDMTPVTATTSLGVVATKLAITTAPSGAVDTVALTTQPVIKAYDAHNNTDTGVSTETITATTDTSNVSVSGTTTAVMASGIATFSGLKANVDGTFTDGASMNLSFNDDGDIGGVNMAAVTSTTSLDVVATQLAITTSPSGAVDLVNLTTQPVIKAYDAHSNTDTGISSETITATSTTANTSLVGNTTSTMTLGIATFSGLKASVDGTFTDDASITLSFDDDGALGTAGNMSAVTTTTPLDVVATKLVVSDVSSAAASPNVRFADNISVTVTAKDVHSNTDPDDVSTISIAIADSTGDSLTLTSSTSTLVAGTKALTTVQIPAANLTATTPDEDTLSLTASDTGVGSTLTTSTADTTLAINFIVSVLSVSCTTTPAANTPVDVTVASVDANSNIDTAYTGSVWMDASSTGPIWQSNGRHTFIAGDNGSYLFNDMIKFTTAEGGVSVTGTDNASPTITGSQTGITVSSSAPSVSSQTPLDNATGTAITVSPTVTFSEAMDSSTVNTNTVQLRASSTDAIINSVVTYNVSTYVATIDPVASLSNSTQYYIWVSGAKDAAGNAMTAYTTKADQEFTTIADSAPSVLSQTPLDNATGTAITVSPTVTFSEAMDSDTINTNTVQLRASSTDAVVNSVVTYVSGTYIATIDPVASLDNSTQYYIWVSGAKDAAGNAMTAYTTKADQEFTTVAQGDGSLAVTSITTKESYAAVAGGWPDGVASTTDGWSWTFNITVPTSETTFKMKFDNWTSGSNTIAVTDNMRFYSAQSSNASTTGSAIGITAASTLSSGMTLTGDTDASTIGRQIQVTVEAKVPTGSSSGSYSTSYGIQSS